MGKRKGEAAILIPMMKKPSGRILQLPQKHLSLYEHFTIRTAFILQKNYKIEL